MNIETIVAGDTLDFPVTVTDYPPADGWTLKYRLTPRFAAPVQAPIDLTAVVVDGEYRIQATPAITANWAPGLYTWARWVEKAGGRQTLSESGQLEIKADPAATAQGVDSRSLAHKALDDALAARAAYQASNGTIQSYTIGSRSVTYKNAADIDVDIKFWQARVADEDADAAGVPRGPLGRIRYGVNER